MHGLQAIQQQAMQQPVPLALHALTRRLVCLLPPPVAATGHVKVAHRVGVAQAAHHVQQLLRFY